MGLWLVLTLWALVLWRLRREEAPSFWRVVSVAQVLLGVQLVIGLVLLAMGRRPGEPGWFDTLFHPLYGFIFPGIVLIVAHAQARSGARSAYAVFSWPAIVIFALTVRGRSRSAPRWVKRGFDMSEKHGTHAQLARELAESIERLNQDVESRSDPILEELAHALDVILRLTTHVHDHAVETNARLAQIEGR